MYELIRTPVARADRPDLDASQQAVVDHPGGPLLVLAGPGTGKTTTLVESVVDRIERRGAAPDRVLVLTFSRKAAADLRTRVAARLGRSVVTPLVLTFHAFCYALVRRFGGAEPAAVPVRLLTAPEQDFRVRETLAGSLDTRRVAWPESVRRAFGTRAFASEVRAVLAKARQLGMDPDDLVAAGEAAGRPEWVAIGEFFDEYLDVLDAEQVLDYAELVHRSRILLADPAVVAQLRSEIAATFVDEYQDTDPAQVRLLQAVAGGGRDVVVVGDPDQSVYAFRGAEARGILDFPDQFPRADGSPAPVLALERTRRFGTALLAASRNVAGRLGLPRSLPGEVFTRFRSPVADPALPRGQVEAMTCTSPGAEAEQIAELLRAAHLREGVPWSQMAVLVRSGRRMIPGLSRALAAADVPVEVAGDEIPLAAEPAVRPLLLALQVVVAGRRPDADEARLLLQSPLGGLDSMGVRQLGRALRSADRAELAGSALPRPSAELVARALHDPELIAECGAGPETAAAGRLADLLARCERQLAGGGSAEEVLWTLWSASSWPERLRRQAARGGDPGRRADRDLDAVCALFAIAARSEEVAGRRGVTAFLAEVEGQQIPADTLRESDTRGSVVRLLTAHRAKGLEWDLVVVAGVQEGSWPDVRRRGSLLEPDRLSPAGVSELPPTAARVAEERRLFYVACTRARRRLVVTAVAGTEGEGDQPSRFLAELGVPVRTVAGRPRRPLTLAALVGELRSVTADPDASAALREQASIRLARLADATDALGQPLVPAADPGRWWGMAELSDAPRPVTAPTDAVHLSGSQLGSLLSCPRQWFLSRKAQAESSRSSAASFGSVVHVLAEHGAHDDVDPAALAEHLTAVWDQLAFDAKWLSAVERVEAESALERFAAWQQARRGQTLLGTEVGFACEVDLGAERVHLTGTADRVERDPDGRVRIVDFKTSRSEPRAADVAVQDQLGVYQLAVQLGAFAEVTGPGARPAGAELVYLRLPDGAGPLPKTFPQASLDDVPFPLGDHDPVLARPGGPDPALLADHPSWVHRRLAAAAADRPGRAVRGPDRGGLPVLPVRRQLPRSGRRPGGGGMTVHLLPTPAEPRIGSPGDLVDALGIGFSDQQLEAITAPLQPGVIIAGAGSGKTTVMAARVVWLVGTGAVRPEEVLGLTFTRKAAAELSLRVRTALIGARVLSERGVDAAGEQVVMTYDAFAARLVAEHGLRIGVETDPTLISGATRYRLASRVVAAAAGPFEYISRLRPASITERVLRLDADLQQHLVDPAALDAHTREHVVALESAPVNNRGNAYADIKKALVAAHERLELASLVVDYQALKARLGLVEFADQMAVAARLAAEVPQVSVLLRDTFKVVLLDEYQDTSAAQAVMLHGLFSGHTPSEGLGHP